MKKKIVRPYEKDKFFKKWLVGLSERTKENYSAEFQEWFDFVGMSPTEQIEKRLKDLTSGNLAERQFLARALLSILFFEPNAEENINNWNQNRKTLSSRFILLNS